MDGLAAMLIEAKNIRRKVQKNDRKTVLETTVAVCGADACSAGADVKIVSQNPGHASTAVTLDTYTHLTEEKKKEQEAVAQAVRIS